MLVANKRINYSGITMSDPSLTVSLKILRPIATLFCALLFVLPGTSRAGEQLAAKPSPPPVEKKEANPLSFWDGKIVLDIDERVRLEVRDNNRDFDAGADHHEITD